MFPQIVKLTVADAATRFPQVTFDGINDVYFEHEAGYLLARRGCAAVQQTFVGEGGDFKLEAIPTPANVATIARRADAVVFACGPWLGKVFPDVIGENVAPSSRLQTRPRPWRIRCLRSSSACVR